ncbi:MAG: ComF family protein [Bacteroidales bacterium]|nr:ComF family protein [Bacteroidales bacterium]
MIHKISEYWNDFISLLYPDTCKACGNALLKTEHYLCTKCRLDIPTSDYWLHKDNPVNQIFWGRTPIEFASAFLLFSKGSRYRKLIHHLKYKGDKDAGIVLGELYGKTLANQSLYKSIDYIIPVPLHPKKLKKRGYNQSDCIAKGLSKGIGAPYRTDILIRTVNTQTQTKKTKEERWNNVSGVFAVNNPEQLEGKHVLIVDDVITTGATIEHCALTMINASRCIVSVACLARA